MVKATMNSPHLDVVEHPHEFVSRAWRWHEGLDFPLIANAALDAYERRLQGLGIAPLPSPPRIERPGIVVVLHGADSSACGRLLAVATGRAIVETSPQALRETLAARAPGTLAAVVGLAEELAIDDDWPLRGIDGVGAVVARTLAGLATLVYRTLCFPLEPEHEDRHVSHPLRFDRAESDATSLHELREIISTPTTTLELRSHGRECCVIFPDGMVCGAPGGTPKGARALPVVAPRRPLPCQLTGRCFHRGVADEDRIAASEVDARVVYLESCSSVALGNELYATGTNVAHGFLSGSAIGVIGSIGTMLAETNFRAVFDAGLAAGAALGTIRDELQASVHSSLELAQFALLGDPAIVPRPGPLPQPSDSRTAAERKEGAWEPPQRHLNILERFRSFRWLDIPAPNDLIDEEERTLVASSMSKRRVLANGWSPDAAIAEIAQQTGRAFADRIHGSWWHFLERTVTGFAAEEANPAHCTLCDRPTAETVRQRHLFARDVSVLTTLCRRCGEVGWRTEGAAVLVDSARYIGFDDRTRFGAVNASDMAVSVTLGCAFVAGDFHRLPPQRVRTATLEPGTRLSVGWDVLPADRLLDDHQVVLFAISEGELSMSLSIIGARATP